MYKKSSQNALLVDEEASVLGTNNSWNSRKFPFLDKTWINQKIWSYAVANTKRKIDKIFIMYVKMVRQLLFVTYVMSVMYVMSVTSVMYVMNITYN